MNKIKKILLLVFSISLLFGLASCKDISDIIKEIKKMAITESMGMLADELGVEDFVLPECSELDIAINYSKEEDKSSLKLDIVEPTCTLEEYKEDVVLYIEDAISKYVEDENITESFEIEPVEIENGYKWAYSFEQTNEEGIVETVSFDIILVESDNTFNFDIEFVGVGDILSKVNEYIENETNK